MKPLMGWRLRADGERVEPVLILDFVTPPVPINGEPIMAVYASTKTGLVNYDYATAFEVEVAPRAMVVMPGPVEPRPSLIERILGPAWSRR